MPPSSFRKVRRFLGPHKSASLTIRCTEYLGDMMELCFNHRAEDVDHKYLDASGALSSRIILTCTMPLSEIVTDFFDKLKSRSSGFASFE